MMQGRDAWEERTSACQGADGVGWPVGVADRGRSFSESDRTCDTHRLRSYLPDAGPQSRPDGNGERQDRFASTRRSGECNEERRRAPLSGSIWKTASAPCKYRLDVNDPECGRAGGFVAVIKVSRPGSIVLHVRARDQKVDQLEVVLARGSWGGKTTPQSALKSPEVRTLISPIFTPVAARARRSSHLGFRREARQRLDTCVPQLRPHDRRHAPDQRYAVQSLSAPLLTVRNAKTCQIDDKKLD